MIIRNNTVYNNNGTAIICSLNCYNITYENNKIHDNNGAGISFSRNNTNSIARNNIINNQETPIEVSASNNNEVYNNAISKSPSAGITVKAGSSENKIYNNIIDNTQDVGIKIAPDSKNNSIYSNKINGITQQALDTKSQSDKVKKQSRNQATTAKTRNKKPKFIFFSIFFNGSVSL